MSIPEVNSSNFQQEVLQSSLPVLVDFYSSMCPPCRALSPQLDVMAREFAGCVKFVKVNVNHDPGLAIRYGVAAVPTLIGFDRGRAVDKVVGGNPEVVRQQLNALCVA